MALFQGLFLLVVGYGLLAVVYRSLSTGWLPFGPNGLKGRLELSMHRQPFAYWSAFTLYCAFGVWLVFLALGMLSGHTAPLPLR